MSDIKILLKTAKKAIFRKNFEIAIEKCESVLQISHNNYSALVLLGVALCQDEKAETMFKTAIELKENDILAYQGLAKYYEKKETDDCLKSLVKLYYRMYTLFTGIESETLDKMYYVILKLDDSNECGNMINDFISKESDGSKRKRLAVMLSKILAESKGKQDANLLSLFEKAISICNQDLNDPFYIKYFECTLQVKGYKLMYKKLLRFRHKSFALKEWICEIFSKSYILKLDQAIDYNKVESVVNDVIVKTPTSEYGKIAVAVIKLMKGEKYDAYTSIGNVLKEDKKNKIAKMLHVICGLELGRFYEVEKSTKALIDSSDSNTVRLKQIMLIAMSSQEIDTKCQEAIKISEELGPECLDEKEYIGLFNAYMHLKMFDKAQSCLKNLINSPAHSSLYSKFLIKTDNVENAVKVMLRNKNNILCKIQLGIHYLNNMDYTNSFKCLLDSVKVDSDNFEAYLNLGDAYTFSGRNLDNARKCYAKAFSLNPESSKAGKNFSRTLINMNDWYSNSVFLNDLINPNSDYTENQYWPWLQLGIHFSGLKTWDQAICNLCTYTRLCPLDPDGWEAIADAYYERGSYTTAMKCYRKVVHLKPKNTICVAQIGAIQCLLGNSQGALNTYATIPDKTFLPSVKGVGEAKLCIANEMFSKHFYGRSRDYAQEVIDLVSPSIKQYNNMTCLRKILYDAIKMVSKLPPKYNWLHFGKDENDKPKLYNGEEILNLAIVTVTNSIGIMKEVDFIFQYELAATHLALYDYSGHFINAKLAFEMMIQCLEVDKTKWQHWNLFGIICMSDAVKKFKHAQHSFIKAIELDPINPMIWSNLGVLYLIASSPLMANKAFKKAQECNPSFLQSWIGQALIAESVEHHDAMDLFRHTSKLGFHTESSFGYAHFVARSFIKIGEQGTTSDDMSVVVVASDLMTWYNESKAKNCCSLNVHGILFEKLECIGNAFKAFKEALTLAGPKEKNSVLFNLARIYSRLKEHHLSIVTIQSAEDSSDCFTYSLGKYYHENGDYKNAYKIFNNLYRSTENDAEKTKLMIAMAKVSFMSKDFENAETLLKTCFEYKDNKTNATVVFALTAFYLLQSDVEKAQAILVGTEKWNKNTIQKEIVSIVALRLYLIMLRDGPDVAVNEICKYVYKYFVNEDDLWKIALEVLRTNVSTVIKVVNKCLSFKNAHRDINLLRVACLVNLASGNLKLSKIYAQKAIRARPDLSDNWILLISTMLPMINEESASDVVYLKKLTEHVLANFPMSDVQQEWMTDVINNRLPTTVGP